MSRTSVGMALLVPALGCAAVLAWGWLNRTDGAGGKGPAAPAAARPPLDADAPAKTATATFALG
jgi:hypothetical protein